MEGSWITYIWIGSYQLFAGRSAEKGNSKVVTAGKKKLKKS